MNRIKLVVWVALILLCFAPKISKATHAAGGEISYEWVSDSTYRIYFKFFRDCSGANRPGSVELCYTNSCGFYFNTVNMSLMSVLPDSTANGAPVSDGCPGVGTKCTNTTSAVPGYREYWYSATVTLPFKCNAWTFSVAIGNRNPSVNLVNAGSTRLYVEATLNNQDAPGNSSPYFSVKPVPSVCVNQSYTYNNGGVDPNSDSLVFEMTRPLNTDVNCPRTTSQIAYASGSPAFNATTNPLQTNNTFVLDTVTGQMTFTPSQIGAGTVTVRIKEYRNGVLIGTVMRDIQIQVISCNVPGPTVSTVNSTIVGGTYANSRVEACAKVNMSFCFDVKSDSSWAKLVATDNGSAATPGSSVVYTGQGTDSVRGCFSWTPGTLDTGLRVFTVSIKDTSCASPGVVVTQTFVLPIYIWPITDIVKDTTICYGDSVTLTAIGGSSFTWSVLSGGSPVTSLSCTTCKTPVAKPLLTTQYTVSNSATQYCSKNKDTATIIVTDIRYDTLEASNNTPICAGDTLKLTSTTAATGLGYSWSGPNNFKSSQQNPAITPTTAPMSGTYYIASKKGLCTSFPDSTVVTIHALPTTPTAGNNGPICAGDTLQLTSSTISGTTYLWSGPQSFSSIAEDTLIANADTANAGVYTVRVTSTTTGCTSLPGTTTPVISANPVIASVTKNNPTTCGGSNGTVYLNGLEASKSYTVNYKRNGVAQTPVVLSSNGSGVISVTGLNAATYSQFIVTLSGCESDTSSSIVVTDPTAPIANVSSNSPICEGADLELYGSSDSTGVTWSWTGPNSYTSTTQSPILANATPAMSGTYILSATKNNCTSGADSVTVIVFPTPATPVAGSNTPVCSDDTLLLTSSTVSGATYSWSGPSGYTSTAQNPVYAGVPMTAAGDYIVTAIANGCPSEPDTTTVVVKQTPAQPNASSNSPVCEDSTLNLYSSTTGVASYSWTGPNSFSSAVQNPVLTPTIPAQTGNYSLTVTNNGCTSIEQVIAVVVNAKPTKPVASNNGPLCIGNNVLLTATSTASSSYSWTGPSSFTSNSQNPIITNAQPAMSGQYIVTASLNGCVAEPDTTTVQVNALPAPVIGGSSVVHPTSCGGTDGSIILTGLTSGDTFTIDYAYQGVPITPYVDTVHSSGTITIGSLPAGVYTELKITSTIGCSSIPIDTTWLNDPIPPVISLDTNISPTNCGGVNGLLRLTGLEKDTTYLLEYDRNSSAATPANHIADVNGKITLSNIDAAVYSNIRVTWRNCVSNILGPITVTDPVAPIAQAANNTPICEQDTLKLTGGSDSTGVTWSWTGPLGYTSTAQNPIINNAQLTQAGDYVLTVTKNNCTSEPDTTTVVVHPIPTTPVATNNGPLCAGSTLMLSTPVVSGATYSWSGPLSYTDTARAPSISNVDTFMAGVYSVVISVNNCVSLPGNTTAVIYHIPVIDSYSLTNPTSCGGSEGYITLKGLKENTSFTVGYDKNSVPQTPVVLSSNGSGEVVIPNLGQGSYDNVTATLNNCTSPSVNVGVLTDPNAPVVSASNNTPACDGDTIQFTATSDSTGVTWSWTGPNGFTSTLQNPTINNALVTHTGTYSLTATKNNCTSVVDTTYVLVHPIPATPTVISNTPLCTGERLQISTAAVSGATYSWSGPLSYSSTARANSINNVDTFMKGIYSVIVTVNNCPSLPGTEQVDIYHTPVIDSLSFGNPTTCNGTQGSITLKGLKPNATFTVNYSKNAVPQTPLSLTTNGAGEIILTGLSAGTYSNISATLNGCSSNVMAGVTLSDPSTPVVQANNNTPVCQDGTVSLSGTSTLSGVTWSWSGPSGYSNTIQNPTISNAQPAQSGVYILTATLNGCTSEPDSTIVTVHPTPVTPVASNNGPLCEGSTLQLTSSIIAGADFSWTGPLSYTSTLQNPSIANTDTFMAGVYSVVATVNNCPSLAGSTTVTIYHIPTIDSFSNSDPTTCNGTQGSITLKGLKENTTFTVNYNKNNVAQSPLSLTSNGVGAITMSGLSAGFYSNISVTLNGCASDTIVGITLSDPNTPVVQANNNTPVCQDGTVSLSGTSTLSGVTWSWSGPLGYTSTVQNPTISTAQPTQSGVYVLTATLNNCTSEPDSTTVIIHPTPATPVASNNGPLCEGSTLQLTSSTVSGADYSWTGPLSYASTLQNPSIANTDTFMAGVYSVVATVNNCPSVAGSTTVAIYHIPTIDSYSYSNPTTCNGTEGTITLKGLKENTTFTVSFNKDNIAQTPQSLTTNSGGQLTISGLGKGLYNSISVMLNNCDADTIPAVTLVDPNAPVVQASNNTPICEDGTFTLSATADSSGVTWSWTGPLSFTSSVQNPVFTNALPTRSGTYYLSAVKNNCTSLVDSTTVIVHPTPVTPVASNNGPLCEGSTLQLTSSTVSGADYSWTGPLSYTSTLQNPSIANADTFMAGVYSVVATVNNCPSVAGSTTVAIYHIPTIDSYSYSNPTTCNGTEGTITLKGLKENTTFTVSFNKDNITQTPQSLTTNSGGQLTISGLGKGLYNGISVMLNNCDADTIPAITLVDPNAPVVQASNNTPICEDGTFTLSATADSSGVTWNWTGPLSFTSSVQNAVFTNALPTRSGTYYLSAVKNNCTSLVDSTIVIVHPTPVTPTAGNNGPLCTGNTLVLSADSFAGATYTWAGVNSYSATGQYPAIANAITSTSGKYWVFTTINGCVSEKDTTTVTVFPLPAPITGTTSVTHPSTCGGMDGEITIAGLDSSVVYVLNYFKNGVAQTPASLSTNSSGVLIISSLTEGVYTDVTVTSPNGCSSDPIAKFVLQDPVPPTISVSATSNPTNCLDSNGYIVITGLDNNTTYTLGYLKDSVLQTPVSITSNGSGEIIISGLKQGRYDSMYVEITDCISNMLDSIILKDPNAPVAIADAKQPICEGLDLKLLASSDSTGVTWSWTGPNSFSSTLQYPLIPSAAITHSGIYSLTASKNNCTSEVDTILITVNPIPATPNGTSNSPLCDGDSLILTSSTVTGALYAWVGPKSFYTDTTQTAYRSPVDTSMSGAYTLRAIVNGCPSLPDTVPVSIYYIPGIDSYYYAHPTTCTGKEGTISLTGLESNTSYTVSLSKNNIVQSPQNVSADNSGVLTITGLTAGLYSGIAITLNGCLSDTIPAITLIDPNAPVVQASNNTPICEGDTVFLSAQADSAGVTWVWTGPNSFSSSTQNPVLANALPIYSGTYYLTAEKNNCTSAIDSTIVTVHPTPATPVAANNGPLCEGSTLQLTTPTVAGATYSWSGPLSFSSTLQNPTIANTDTFMSGQYEVVNTVNGCPSLAGSTLVKINHIPEIDTYAFVHPTGCNLFDGIITLKGVKPNDTFTINYKKNGTAQTAQTSVANGTGEVQLTGLSAGVYSGVTVMLDNCTSDSIGTVILQDPNAPTVTASNSTPVCEGGTVQLTGFSDSTGVSWSWSGPAGYSSVTQSPSITGITTAQAGVYTLTVTKNNCSDFDTTLVIVYPAATTPTVSSNGPLCAGDNLQLTSSTVAGATYSWTGPNSFTSSLQNPVINNATTAASGNYVLTVTTNSCPSLPATETVAVYEVPTITNLSASSPTTCNGTQGTITLTGLISNTSFIVNYKKGGVPQTTLNISSNSSGVLVIAGLSAGTYSDIQVTNVICSSNIVGPVTLTDPIAPIVTAANDISICEGSTIQLSATANQAGVSWSWSGPASYSSANQNNSILNAVPAQTGNYIVQATRNNCTSLPDTMYVEVKPTPATPVAQNNGPLCAGDTLELSTGLVTGGSYQWTGVNNFSDTNRLTGINAALPFQSGDYSVIVTVRGCVSQPDTTTVNIYPIPQVPIATPPTVEYCKDDTPIQLSATGNNKLWYTTVTGGTGSATAPTPSTNVPSVSTWYVSQTVNGCESQRAGVVVTVHALPAPPVATADTIYCQNDQTATLTASGTNLRWYVLPTDTGVFAAPTPSSAAAGVFKWYVSQTDINGCLSEKDSVSVTITANLNANILQSDDTICLDEQMTIQDGNTGLPAAMYKWDFGTANVLSGDSSGPYRLNWNTTGTKQIKLRLENADCGNPDSINVYVAPIPDAIFQLPVDGCLNEEVTLTRAKGDDEHITWSLDDGGELTDSTKAYYTGTWSSVGNKMITIVVGTDAGCLSEPFSQIIEIHEQPLAKVEKLSSNDLCNGDTVIVEANLNEAYTYAWSGVHSYVLKDRYIAAATVKEEGYLTVLVTDEWGCTSTDSAFVTEHPCCMVSLPNAFTPNGDGLNDKFRIISTGNQEIGVFIIIDRWGEKVFETNNPVEGWDGNFRGEPAEVGTYHYYIKYRCTSNEVFEQKGDVILMR